MSASELTQQYESLDSATVRRLSQQPDELIRMANAVRLGLSSAPAQSEFRVVAFLIVTFGDLPIESEDRPWAFIVGSNCEPGNINGSICGERAALCRMRLWQNPQIRGVVVTTDCQDCVSPGALCREFLNSAATPDVPVVIGNSTGKNTTICKLSDLLPSPYAYRYTRRGDIFETAAKAFGKRMCLPVGSPLPVADKDLVTKKLSETVSLTSGTWGDLTEEDVHTVMTAALDVNHLDDDDGSHPIRFSAAVLFQSGETYATWQLKGLEYGCTLDCTAQLLREMILRRRSSTIDLPKAVVMVDQFGTAHAPFSAGRSQLCERGFGDVRVIVHSDITQNTVTAHTANELLPQEIGAIRLLTHDDFVHN